MPKELKESHDNSISPNTKYQRDGNYRKTDVENRLFWTLGEGECGMI